jgi:hypothetical protein
MQQWKKLCRLAHVLPPNECQGRIIADHLPQLVAAASSPKADIFGTIQ